jgi:hypothetical protein
MSTPKLLRQVSRSLDDEHRVLRFRRRGRVDDLPGWRASDGRGDRGISPDASLARYERDGGDDDERHRMMVNIMGFGAAAVLVAIGSWLAIAIGGS